MDLGSKKSRQIGGGIRQAPRVRVLEGLGTAPAAYGRSEASISRDTNGRIWEGNAAGVLPWLSRCLGEASLSEPSFPHFKTEMTQQQQE